MKEKLRIGNIPILFIHQYSNIFGQSIKQYHIDDLGMDFYVLEVEIKDDIKLIQGGEKSVYENKVMIRKDGFTHLFSYNKAGFIKTMISSSQDFKQITIQLNKSLGKELAEFEYVLSGMMFFEIAMNNGYLPIHASAISINNKAILLSGPSHSGKSTQTKFVLDRFPKAIIINEDKPLIYENNEKLYVCGSPWSGKNVLNTNMQVEVLGIFFINKASTPKLVTLSKKEKLKEIMKNIHRSGDGYNINQMVRLVEKILHQTKVFRYDCINFHASTDVIEAFLEVNNEN